MLLVPQNSASFLLSNAAFPRGCSQPQDKAAVAARRVRVDSRGRWETWARPLADGAWSKPPIRDIGRCSPPLTAVPYLRFGPSQARLR